MSYGLRYVASAQVEAPDRLVSDEAQADWDNKEESECAAATLRSAIHKLSVGVFRFQEVLVEYVRVGSRCIVRFRYIDRVSRIRKSSGSAFSDSKVIIRVRSSTFHSILREHERERQVRVSPIPSFASCATWLVRFEMSYAPMRSQDDFRLNYLRNLSYRKVPRRCLRGDGLCIGSELGVPSNCR